MLNHAGNSYVTRRIQIISHMRPFYHPFVYLFCILIRSGSISNDAVAKQSKQRSGILKRNDDSTSSVFHFILIDFVLIKKCHITYISSLLGQLYQNIRPSVTQKLRRVMSPSAFNIGQGCRVNSSLELIFLYVILEAMWYMYNVNIFFGIISIKHCQRAIIQFESYMWYNICFQLC